MTDTQIAYIAYLERELKRSKEQLKQHVASELEKEKIIEELLNDKRSGTKYKG